MSAAHDTRVCERFERWLSAYVDAELDAVHCLEVEEHIAACEGCNEFVEHMQRTRSSLRRVSREDAVAPSSLRQRVSATLLEARVDGEIPEDVVAESTREPDTGSVRPAAAASAPAFDHLRYIVPLAAAATVALVFGAMRLQEPAGETMASNDPIETTTASTTVPTTAPLPATPVAAQASAWTMFLDALAQRHLQPPALETFDPKGVEEYAPHIGVRVSSPSVRDAQWVGARLETNAALIRFMRNRKPVTVFVFDPRRVHMQPTAALRPRVIDHEPVLAGKVRGVAMAASEQDGVGYALATDASVDEAARLILTAAP
ncbi:MAG TPA: hypothetical protein ENK57_04440 [Polyangiaceae bacterium]|nr:hypothetical protein [Polyangiaceae bacterium]